MGKRRKRLTMAKYASKYAMKRAAIKLFKNKDEQIKPETVEPAVIEPAIVKPDPAPVPEIVAPAAIPPAVVEPKEEERVPSALSMIPEESEVTPEPAKEVKKRTITKKSTRTRRSRSSRKATRSSKMDKTTTSK
jgi:hypothetical protein